MARWSPWGVISAVTWQRYCANKNGSAKPVSNCWRRVDLPGRVVHRASQGGWSKRLSLMYMGGERPKGAPVHASPARRERARAARAVHAPDVHRWAGPHPPLSLFDKGRDWATM